MSAPAKPTKAELLARLADITQRAKAMRVYALPGTDGVLFRLEAMCGEIEAAIRSTPDEAYGARS